MFLDGANDTLCTPHTVIYVCAKHTHNLAHPQLAGKDFTFHI